MSVDLVGILSPLCVDAVAFLLVRDAEVQRIMEARLEVRKRAFLSLCVVKEEAEHVRTASGGVVSLAYLTPRVLSVFVDERSGVKVYELDDVVLPTFIDADPYQVFKKMIYPSRSSCVHFMGPLDDSFDVMLRLSHASSNFKDVSECPKDPSDQHKCRLYSKLCMKTESKSHTHPSRLRVVLSRNGVFVASVDKPITYVNSFHTLPSPVKEKRRDAYLSRGVISKK